MRILFTCAPGVGHAYPLIPTAWAARAAGHEVRFACYGVADRIAEAGLPVLDTAPSTGSHERFKTFFAEYPQHEREVDERGGFVSSKAGALFGHVSEPAIERTVVLAKSFAPDVVVHSPTDGAGPLAAAFLGVPAVTHGISSSASDPAFTGAIAAHLADWYAAYGAEPVERAACIDVVPPRLLADPRPGWQFRYVPYNGGAVLPEWLLDQPGRDRVLVTLGSVVPRLAGTSGLGTLLHEAAEVEAEFVLALGDADLAEFGPLPANVRQVPWVPLADVLPSCAAVVHHGGAGTTWTAFAAGVPQLVLPHGMDHHVNAEVVARLGTGTVIDAGAAETLNAARVTALLADEHTRARACAFAGELGSLPGPAAIPERLAGLVADR